MDNLYWYFIFLSGFLFVLSRRFLSKKIIRSPPSPPGLPIIGHLHLIKRDLYEDLTSLSSKYGPIFSLRFGCRSFLVVSSPSAIEECFTENDIVLANRPKSMAADTFTYNYGTVSAAPYGQLWRVLRRFAVVECFSVNSLQKSSIVREEEIHMILRSLFRVSKNGVQRVDLHYWISVYALNVITRMVAGRRSIREEDACDEFGKKVMEESRKLFGSAGPLMTLCDFFPIFRWIGYKGLEKRMISLQKRREVFLQCLVDEVRQGKPGNMQREKKQSESLIETLLSHQELEPDFLSDKTIKSMISVMFSAGRETSSLTTEWAMSLLLNHPNAMEKLRSEMDKIVGHSRLLDESDISKLTYLRCVINETMRLYPAAPLLLPHCASQDCKVGGYDIRAGTIVFANAWGVHRDPKLWEQPEKFMPERFEAKEELSSKFLPFGIGRRACPGANLGIRNVSLAVGALIQCFEWEKVEDEHGEMDSSFENRITLNKAKPLEAKCIPRPEMVQLVSQL